MPTAYNIYEHIATVRRNIESRTNALNEFHAGSSLHFTPYGMKTMVEGNNPTGGSTEVSPTSTAPAMSIDELTKSLVPGEMASEIIKLQQQFLKTTEKSKKMTEKIQNGGAAMLLNPQDASSDKKEADKIAGELIEEMVNTVVGAKRDPVLKAAKINKDKINEVLPKLIENADTAHETWSNMFYRWGSNIASGASWIFAKSKEFMKNILTFNFSKEGVVVAAVMILLLWWVLSALGLVASIGSVASSIGSFIMEWIGSPLMKVANTYMGTSTTLLWSKGEYALATKALTAANATARATSCFTGGGGVSSGSMLAAKVVGSANPIGLTLTGLWTTGCLLYTATMGVADATGYSSASQAIKTTMLATEQFYVRTAVNGMAPIVLMLALKRDWLSIETAKSLTGLGGNIKATVEKGSKLHAQVRTGLIAAQREAEASLDQAMGMKGGVIPAEYFLDLQRTETDKTLDGMIDHEDRTGKPPKIGKAALIRQQDNMIIDKKLADADKMDVDELNTIALSSKRKRTKAQEAKLRWFMYMNGACDKDEDLPSGKKLKSMLNTAMQNKEKRLRKEEKIESKKEEGLSIDDINVGDILEYIHLDEDKENPHPGQHNVTSKSAKKFGMDGGRNSQYPRKWRKVVKARGGWGSYFRRGEVPTFEKRRGEVATFEKRRGEVATVEKRRGEVATVEKRRSEVATFEKYIENACLADESVSIALQSLKF